MVKTGDVEEAARLVLFIGQHLASPRRAPACVSEVSKLLWASVILSGG